jgi:hypothetical protein
MYVHIHFRIDFRRFVRSHKNSKFDVNPFRTSETHSSRLYNVIKQARQLNQTYK